MRKKFKREVSSGYGFSMRYQKYMPSEAARILQAKKAGERKFQENRQLITKRYERVPAQKIIKEVEEEENKKAREKWAYGEHIKARLRAALEAPAYEARRILSSRNPMFKAEVLENVIVPHSRRRKRIVRLRYQPMSKNILEAGKEQLAWK